MNYSPKHLGTIQKCIAQNKAEHASCSCQAKQMYFLQKECTSNTFQTIPKVLPVQIGNGSF